MAKLPARLSENFRRLLAAKMRRNRKTEGTTESKAEARRTQRREQRNERAREQLTWTRVPNLRLQVPAVQGWDILKTVRVSQIEKETGTGWQESSGFRPRA